MTPIVSRLPGYYPPLLPEDILSKEVKTGEIDPKLWIPVEDLQDGWKPHGQVGQEVYGAGVGFGVVPRQYVKMDKADCILFTEYPITAVATTKNKAFIFKIIGSENFQSRLILLPNDTGNMGKITVSLIEGSKTTRLKPVKSSSKMIEYVVSGGQQLILEW